MDNIAKKIQEIIDELNAVGRVFEDSAVTCEKIIEQTKGNANGN